MTEKAKRVNVKEALAKAVVSDDMDGMTRIYNAASQEAVSLSKSLGKVKNAREKSLVRMGQLLFCSSLIADIIKSSGK